MDTLSRREEEALLKTTKARAQKECDPVIKGRARKTLFYTSHDKRCNAVTPVVASGASKLRGWLVLPEAVASQRCASAGRSPIK
jgi:hypothetical protein